MLFCKLAVRFSVMNSNVQHSYQGCHKPDMDEMCEYLRILFYQQHENYIKSDSCQGGNDLNRHMDTIINRLNGLHLGHSDLQHDMSVILESWMYELEEMDNSRFKIKPRSFRSTQELYQEMSMTMHEFNIMEMHAFNIMDIMPYIDEYLEYYEAISSGPCDGDEEEIK